MKKENLECSVISVIFCAMFTLDAELRSKRCSLKTRNQENAERIEVFCCESKLSAEEVTYLFMNNYKPC